MDHSFIQGPTIESIVLGNHKYYTRKELVPDEYNLKYELIPLDCDVDLVEVVNKVLPISPIHLWYSTNTSVPSIDIQ